MREAELMPSPRRLALQRQAGKGSVLTLGVIVTKCLTTVAELSEFRSGSHARTEGSHAAARHYLDLGSRDAFASGFKEACSIFDNGSFKVFTGHLLGLILC